MKRIFRKNQIIITVLAVMIAVAGYLNYSGRLLEEEAGRIASGEDTVLLTAENEGTVLTDTVLDAEDITLDGEISQEAAASDVVEENTGVEDTPGTAVLASTSAGDSLIAQEGAIQIFQEFNTGMEEIIVGVVGVLQFDVLKYRLENEYNVDIRLDMLPYEHIRWIENTDLDLDRLVGTSDMKKIKDLKDRPLLLFVNSWSVGMVLDRNPGLQLSEFGR